MIQIYTFKSLSSDLAMHLNDAPPNPGALQWYAHRVQIMRRKCVIAMEMQSRYAMLFPAMTKPDFLRFPETFRDRLVREASTICAFCGVSTEEVMAVAELAAESVKVMAGTNRSVQGHINEVARDLDWRAREIGALPANDSEAFSFGLWVNETPPGRKGERDMIIPLLQMQNFWLGMREQIYARSGASDPQRGPTLH